MIKKVKPLDCKANGCKPNSFEGGFRFMVNGRKLVLASELVKIELPPLYHEIISTRRLENQSTQKRQYFLLVKGMILQFSVCLTRFPVSFDTNH